MIREVDPLKYTCLYVIQQKELRLGYCGGWVNIQEYYTAERKKELLPFATAWMELESIMLSEISQAVRDKYHMISPLTGT